MKKTDYRGVEALSQSFHSSVGGAFPTDHCFVWPFFDLVLSLLYEGKYPW